MVISKKSVSVQELVNMPCELCGKRKIMYKYLFNPYNVTRMAMIPADQEDYQSCMFLCGRCKRTEDKLTHTDHLRDSPYRTKGWITPLPDDIEVILITDLTSIVVSIINPSWYGELKSCKGINEVYKSIHKAIQQSIYGE